MKRNNILIYITIILSMVSQMTYGQSDVLKQKLSLKAENTTISEILLEIEEKVKVKFAFNSKHVKGTKRVSVDYDSQSLDIILDDLLDNKFEYKRRSSYLIIKRRKDNINGSSSSSSYLEGYVVDDETNENISNVSVYTSSGSNLVTDHTGSFKIEFKEDDHGRIEFRKKDYEPFSFDANGNSNDNVRIGLKAIKSLVISLERDSIRTLSIAQNTSEVKTMFPVNETIKINKENIQDTLYKAVTFSLYPGIATYGNLSGNIVYNFALNFVGYNRAISGLELGALSNINKDYVTGVQLAGLSNYLGGQMTGVQMSGIFNKVGGRLKGAQLAGISNVNFSGLNGLQMGGISNSNRDSIKGAQLAGVFNYSKSLIGLQMSGVYSQAETSRGVQVSGVMNLAKYTKGLQMSGVYNQADTINGSQISGLINVAKKVDGFQLGIINVADTINGVPIGILSFVRDGFKRIGLASDEVFPLNLRFKTGVRQLYSILNGGVQPSIINDDKSFYSFGFGFGSSKSVGKNFATYLEATYNVITKRDFVDHSSNNLKGEIGLEYKIGYNSSITLGASFNAYRTNVALLQDEDYNNIRESYVFDTFETSENDSVWRGWVGYTVGLYYLL